MSRACDRCEVMLSEDALRYIVEIHVTADVPPTLDLEMSEDELEAELRAALAALDAVSARKAEAQVHERMVFLLCPSCRTRFSHDPLGTGRHIHTALQ